MSSIRIFIMGALFFTNAHMICAMQSSEEKKTQEQYFKCSQGMSQGPESSFALNILPPQGVRRYLRALSCILNEAQSTRDRKQGATLALIAS